MAVPPAPDGPVTSSSPSTSGPAPRRSPGLRPVLVLVFAVVLIGCLASLTYLAGERAPSGASFSEQVSAIFKPDTTLADEREVAMSQSKQFVLRLNTYGPQLLDGENAMPKYRALVKEVTTAKFGADFEENAGLAEQTVAQAGVGRVAEVFSTGVSALDADSATVLVAGSFTNSYPNPQDPEERVDTDSLPFRFEVSLDKIDGTWLIDDFIALTGEQNQGEPQP